MRIQLREEQAGHQVAEAAEQALTAYSHLSPDIVGMP